MKKAVARCLSCQKTIKLAWAWFRHDSHKQRITAQEAKMADNKCK